MTKAILLACALLVLAACAWAAAYFHAQVPPNCTDPRTLALVSQSLTRQHLPPATRLEHIRTVAGGFLALRFVCEATLDGFSQDDLPTGMPVPDFVHYTSRLTPDGSRHEVSVTIQPLLMWEKVQ